MKHVVTQPTKPFQSATGEFTVHQVPVWQDNLVWVLVCNQTGEAAAVDGPEAQPVLDYCSANDINLTTIFNTHIHGDHIGINRELARLGTLSAYRVVGCRLTADEIPGMSEPVDEGDLTRLGDATLEVWRTEGHIDGHISYLADGVLFCGDTMFGAGCGYLFDGPPAKMQASLARFASLPDDTLVCCAHEYTEDNLRFAWSVEPQNHALAERIRATWKVRATGRSSVPSTIAIERATNPFLRWHSPELQRSVLQQSNIGLAPSDVFAATRALKDSKGYRAFGDEVLPIG